MNSVSSRRKKPLSSGRSRGVAERDAAERHALPALQSRSRATRSRILAAAERVFAESGYDGARLADIAERAGCSVGAVYFRFEDKSALFLAIAESFAADARARLGDVLSGAGGLDTEQIVRRFVMGTAENIRRHKGLFRAIVERGIDHPQAMATMLQLRGEFASALEAMLADDAKQHSALHVRVMTQMVYGFLLAGVLSPQAPTKISDAGAVSELADACVAYLRFSEDMT